MNGKFLRVPQNLKEQFKKDFDIVRDEFEQQNLGSFEKLYPCPENQDQWQEYERYLKASRKVWLNKETRYGSKIKRRLTTVGPNQPMLAKSVSPQKKERTKVIMNNAGDSTVNFQTPVRSDPQNNKTSRRLHTTET